MNITCPQCNTVYRLPDEKFRPGIRLRCSICKHVFTVNEEAVENHSCLEMEETIKGSVAHGLSLREEGLSVDSGSLPNSAQHFPAGDFSEPGRNLKGTDELTMPAERHFSFSGIFSLLLCAGFGVGGWWLWMNTPYLNGIKDLIRPYIGEVAEVKTDDPLAMISQLEFQNVSQSRVKNEKLGELVVITGKVRNNFPAPRAFIRLAASLYDSEGKCIMEKRQLAGASLGKYQLESFNAEELKDALDSKLEIAASNTNVLSGGEVPFTVVFSDVPEGASDYKVKILEASIPRVGNLTE